MRKILNILTVICGCYSTFTVAKEEFLCIPDATTGFTYSNSTKKWTPTIFESDSKYILSKDDDGNVVFREISNPNIKYICPDKIGTEVLFCDRPISPTPGGLPMLSNRSFTFNSKNGRFINTIYEGYFNVGDSYGTTDENSGEPYIEIGKCSPF